MICVKGGFWEFCFCFGSVVCERIYVFDLRCVILSLELKYWVVFGVLNERLVVRV